MSYETARGREVIAEADEAVRHSRAPLFALVGAAFLLFVVVMAYLFLAQRGTKHDVTSLQTTVREVPCESAPPGAAAPVRRAREARCRRTLRSYARACLRYPSLCVLARRQGARGPGDLVIVPFAPPSSVQRQARRQAATPPPPPGPPKGPPRPRRRGSTGTPSTSGRPGPSSPPAQTAPPAPAPSPSLPDLVHDLGRTLGGATGGATCQLGIPC